MNIGIGMMLGNYCKYWGDGNAIDQILGLWDATTLNIVLGLMLFSLNRLLVVTVPCLSHLKLTLTGTQENEQVRTAALLGSSQC